MVVRASGVQEGDGAVVVASGVLEEDVAAGDVVVMGLWGHVGPRAVMGLDHLGFDDDVGVVGRINFSEHLLKAKSNSEFLL